MSEEPSAKKVKTSGAAESNNVDDSMNESDMDAAIIELEMIHNELDKLGEQENDEVIALDQKYKKLRQECFTKRTTVIDKIPDFWFNVFTGHPELSTILTEEEEDCLHYLHKMEVDMADNNSGYNLKFYFKSNPYFRNDCLVKEVSYKQDKMVSVSTNIDWIKPQKKAKATGKKRARDEPKSFFQWFSSNDDPANDKIAEIIKDDVWANSLQYYIPDPDMEAEEASSEGSENEGDKEGSSNTSKQASDNGTTSN